MFTVVDRWRSGEERGCVDAGGCRGWYPLGLYKVKSCIVRRRDWNCGGREGFLVAGGRHRVVRNWNRWNHIRCGLWRLLETVVQGAERSPSQANLYLEVTHTSVYLWLCLMHPVAWHIRKIAHHLLQIIKSISSVAMFVGFLFQIFDPGAVIGFVVWCHCRNLLMARR